MKFSDRELKLLLNSTHERAMHLLSQYSAMQQKAYRNARGSEPTKGDIDNVYAGHKEHLDLVEKIRMGIGQ